MKNNRFLFAIAAALLMMTSGCKLSNNNDYANAMERYINEYGEVTMGDKKDAEHYVMGDAAFAATEVRELGIDWMNDSVTVEAYDGTELVISETSDKALNDTTTMYHYLNAKGKLNIKFGKPGVRVKVKEMGIPDKHLLVRVPRTLHLGEVEVNGVGYNFRMDSVSCNTFEINSVTNQVTLNECEINEVEANSVCVTIEATFSKMPKEMELNNVSGETVLWVPEDAGITIEMEGVMSDFRSELPVVKKRNKKVIGNGACNIESNSVSGKLDIKVKK